MSITPIAWPDLSVNTVTAGGKPDKRALAELALERAGAAPTRQAAW